LWQVGGRHAEKSWLQWSKLEIDYEKEKDIGQSLVLVDNYLLRGNMIG